ncbi:MAG TPA: hypothetical protein DHU56_03885 [Marinobacter sp.]|jgi:hypothetical protein|uniref:hypothetical protein n=1 Tax=Marinobacter sp. TaxID=50741 RepID=UPI000EE2BFFA|nr:hypothetical protein [Marinobacter sp.]MBC7191994.1 hypothetical protein [Marinobacter sp.]HCW89183.1 hypothetical protein [Marinobacter sp.]
MPRLLPFLSALFILSGCQLLPSETEGDDIAPGTVLLSAQHCLKEYIKDLRKIHFGPCLKVVSVNGQAPSVREDGFITLPISTPLRLETSCVYRHADGTPIPATVTTATFEVTSDTFTKAGKRWYLHPHKQARNVAGCEPTLAPSVYPTYGTH